jgi:hypothetical protein
METKSPCTFSVFRSHKLVILSQTNFLSFYIFGARDLVIMHNKIKLYLVCVPDWSPSNSVVTEHDERSSIEVQFGDEGSIGLVANVRHGEQIV